MLAPASMFGHGDRFAEKSHSSRLATSRSQGLEALGSGADLDHLDADTGVVESGEVAVCLVHIATVDDEHPCVRTEHEHTGRTPKTRTPPQIRRIAHDDGIDRSLSQSSEQALMAWRQ